ncbi:MAG: metallophosphoesterase [Ignavibacteriaceae bacterium]|nr:metallophosphoesterase [Ignavibacteriaceae bacterium]
MKKAYLFIFLLFIANLHATISMQPYLMGVTSNSVYVLVECSTTDPVTVSYGLTASYGNTATDELYSTTAASPVTYVHKIKLTGLSSGTVYHYQAVQLTSTSADYNFQTAPLPGSSFRFAWEADMRTNLSPHDQISALIKAANPLFLLQGGDVCSGSTYTTFKSEFFRTNELNNLSYIPFFWACGNHETWSTNTIAFSKAPASGSGIEDYYSFDYGDIHFLLLNTQESYAVGSAQYNFALSDLSTTTKRWKIVIGHIPGYTAGGSGSHTEDANMIAMSVNIFTPYGVDLVLNGHNHFYQHNKVSGIDYVVIGSAGAPLYPTATASYTVKSVSDYCYGIFDFTPTSLKMSVYNNLNSFIDTLTLFKAPLPVEITTFNVIMENNTAKLNWQTATELNNFRFDIERKTNNQEWINIGSIPGAGNSSSPKKYSFLDRSFLFPGKYSYRLKQVDFDGHFNYSRVITIESNITPQNYSLGQNYPNPFNPSTTINYTLASDSHVRLTLYDALGKIVRDLVDQVQPGGNLSINVNANDLPSGIYFYTLHAKSIENNDDFISTNKMILMK